APDLSAGRVCRRYKPIRDKRKRNPTSPYSQGSSTLANSVLIDALCVTGTQWEGPMLIEALAAVTMLSGGGSQEAAPYAPGGQQRVAPRGDYRDSCSSEYVNRGRLYADCRDRRGNIRGTSIELNRCTAHEIRNDDGRLVCGPFRGDYEDRPGRDRPDRPGPDRPDNGGGWGGGREEITVYRDALYRGASTTFRGDMANLRNSGFNDVISS